ncbi:hypothetical protein AB833_10200 [Chromatiales bacterium (ex Bugula neritina AB1)]|nr:hypothetical protein AB833_10200 [Chromatiales bacterium (ex Bugula neritina AB1)]
MAVPLIGAQLLSVSNGLVDALVAGQLGRAELAAGGIAAGIWFFASLSCIGLMGGLSPTLSRLIGQRRRNIVGAVFRQGLWLAVITGGIATATALAVAALLPRMSLEAELVPLIRQYLLTAAWSLPAFAIVMACRNACEATALTRPVLIVQVLGLGINILADLAFGLGWFGFPQFGLMGIGIATSVVMITMAAALLFYLSGKRFARYNLLSAFEGPRWADIRPMLVLSIPIYLTLLFEAGLFVSVSLQMGMIGTIEAGAHYIAIGVTSFCFMLPLGLSFALTARMGRVYGRQSLAAAKLRIVSGLLITVMLAVFTIFTLIVFRYPLISLYTDDPELIAVAAQLLLLAALFQLSDGAQVALLGLLRGLQDVRVPMLINAFSYWAVAFPLGYFSAHRWGYGATGLWWGLIAGLSVSALLLALRLVSRINLYNRQGGFAAVP